MAPKEEEEPSDEEEEEDTKKTGESAKEAKQLDSLTDFVDEDKVSSKVDTKEVEAKLNELRKKKEESNRERAEHEKKLAQVKIKKEDLDLMCSELPLCDRDVLERVLREHDADLVAALRSAVRTFPTNS
eukprot:TRINITY_DN111235_c0_g1_i1.p1 TRINITY_DN111235_c0_g1~~TRINITY_DN111235_c0_g1_i1.p1  ORF type:complete len:129 (+),score=51.40 TRINITY_DN111235_c0_g1_i1:68-454(+)